MKHPIGDMNIKKIRGRVLVIECLILAILFLLPTAMISSVAVDTDGDNWDDLYEKYIGTDPNNPDTDGDYIRDDEDPTPKGGLLNEDEIWDVFIIEIIPESVLVDEGSQIKVAINVQELLPKGIELPADNETGTLKVYWGSYYGNLDMVWTKTVTIYNGTINTSYTPAKAGIYYFILVLGDDTLGAQTSRYEMDWLKSKGKGGYCSVAVYPHYYATVSEIYPYLLPGMNGSFTISFYEFKPGQEVTFTKYSTSVSLSKSALEDLYILSNGSVQIQVSDYNQGSSIEYTIQVNGSTIWDNLFTKIGTHTISVYSFDSDFSWDYTFSAKFTFSRSYVQVFNPEALWHSINNTILFQTAELTVHRYSLDAGMMNASVFNQRYKECGSIEGIIKKYISEAIPWMGTAELYALYVVYDCSDYQPMATVIKYGSISISGSGSLYYTVTTPGSYRFACTFDTNTKLPMAGKFYLDNYRAKFNIMAYFQIESPIQLFLHTQATQFFTGDSIEIVYTLSDSGAKYNIQSYLDGTKDKLLKPVNGVVEHSITLDTNGEHILKGVIIFNTQTANLLDLFGIDNFYGDWLDQTRLEVYDLAIIADPPSTLVIGIETQFRVIVQKNRASSASGAGVTVTLTSNYYPSNTVFTGQCDSDGLVLVSFLPPSTGNYNKMEITASIPGREENMITPISIRDQNYQGITTLNKPLYHPNDMILTRFLVFNKDLMTPAAGNAEVRLRDPYRRDIYREEVALDEYGCGNIEIPVGQKAPWGTYSVMIYYNDKQVDSVAFNIKEYKTPEIKLTLQEAEAVQGENITISAYVEYLFGQSVRMGEVNLSISLQNERPYYYRWWSDIYYFRSKSTGTEDITNVRGRAYGSYDTIWNKYVNVNVTDGWANITLYVPYNADRIYIIASFSDDLDHEASAEKAYYIGKKPVENAKTTLKLTSTKSQWAVGDEPDLTVTLFWSKDGKEYPLKNAQFSLKFEALNIQYNKIGPFWYNGTTDSSGKWSGTLLDFGTNTQNLMKADFYWLEFSAIGEAVEGGAVEATLTMPIYRYIYQISTDETYYARGESVNIKFKQHDLLENEGIPGEVKLEIRSKYSNYYISSYGSDLVYSRSFSMGSTGELLFDWRVPLGLAPGLYDLKATYENATVFHTIQVIDYESNLLTLNAPKSYRAGQTFTIAGEFSKTYDDKIFIDTFSADVEDFSTQTVNDKEFSIELMGPATRTSVDIFIYYLDNGLYRSERISISPELPKLELKIELERENYEPGELMNLTVKAFSDGKAYENELLLALVITDQGVYELVQDTLSDVSQLSTFTSPSWLHRGYYPNRNFRDMISKKSEGLSLITEVRRIITKPSPYHGGGNGSWDDKYPSSTDSDADGVMNSADEVSCATDADDYDNQGSLDAELESTEVRKFFTETAQFIPGMVFNGKTKITFKLPDNIVRWRIKALVSSKNLLGCYSTSSFNVSKKFFIDLKLPSPLTQDDMATFTVRVYNFAGKTLQAAVGIKLADDWLQILDGAEKSISLTDGEVKDVKFLVNILGYDWQSLTAIGSDFVGHTDALVKTVYIRPNGALKVSHYSGVVGGKESLKFTFDPELMNDTEKVTLRLSPGYSGLLLDGAGALCSYTYGCTEQTMSSLLPNILIWEYLKEKGELTPQIRYRLSCYIIEGVQQLYSYRHYDGGWGWWKGDESDPWMTAYVLYGLARANEAGFYVDQTTIAGAQNFLNNIMTENGRIPASSWMNDDNLTATAFSAYSLAFSSSSYTQKAINSLNIEFDHGNISDPYVLVFYALSLMETGQDNSKILKTISTLQIGSHWESSKALGGNDEVTAWCVCALAQAEQGSYKEETRGAMEYLAALRRPWGGWATTSDTVAALHAVLAVLKTSGTVDLDVNVNVNGETIKSVHVDESYASRQNFHSAMDAIDLTEKIKVNGDNKIEILSSGTGDLFYELTVIQYLRTDAVISIPTEIDCTEEEETYLEIKIDPKNSENVNMVDAEVILGECDEISVLYVEETRPVQEDDVWVFKVYLVPNKDGIINISPVVVSYRLSAGFGESGVIRRYFGPVILHVEPGKLSPLNGTFKDVTLPTNSDLVVTKLLSKNLAKIGDTINVTIVVNGLTEDTELEGLSIMDTIPSGFEIKDKVQGPMNLIFPLNGNDNITYSMVLKHPFNGQLPPAKLIHQESTLTLPLVRSNAVVFATAGDDINVLRTYSKTKAQVGDTVEVNITVQSLENVPYVVIEDYVPPSCNFDLTSLDAMSNGNDNIMEYSIDGNKVAIFVKSIEKVSICYRFTVNDIILAPISPTRAYGMYDPDTVGESSAKLFSSYQGGVDESIDDWDITPGPADNEEAGDGPMPNEQNKDKEDEINIDWGLSNPFLSIAIILVPIAIIATSLYFRKQNHDGKKGMNK